MFSDKDKSRSLRLSIALELLRTISDLLEQISTNEDLNIEEFRRIVGSFGVDIATAAKAIEEEIIASS